MSDPQANLAALTADMNTLETSLAPLFAQSFEELSKEADPLEKAKLGVTVGYMVHDLIWIYLRLTGIEPSTHPVMQELERLKGYFEKIDNAGRPRKTDAPRFQIDKAAAGRFIAAAIGSSIARVDPNYTPPTASSSAPTHTRFDEAADKLLENEEEGEEEEVEEEMTIEKVVQDEVVVPEGQGSSKRARMAMDPFAGYDSPQSGKGKKGKAKGDEKKKLAFKKAKVAGDV